MPFHRGFCSFMTAAALAMPVAIAADTAGPGGVESWCDASTAWPQQTEKDAVSVLLEMDRPAAPARQATIVWFHQPVRVGDHILLGKYVIEHDNDRMARGRPCTHIYAAHDMRLPVVAFHCTHLTRPAPPQNTVTLRRRPDASIGRELSAFQFAGDPLAHGVPNVR